MVDDSLQIHKASDNNPNISMTERAMSQTRKWLSKTGGIGLRLSTKETGCSGLEYVIDIIYEVNPTDLISRIDNHVTVYIDSQAFAFLKGSKLDYVQDGLNYKFIFENPNATGVCGCGESFTVK